MSFARLLLPFLILACLFNSSPLSAKEPIRVVEGTVVKVSDGDTVTVESEGNKLKVRLYGIDAPEVTRANRRTGAISKAGQPYGEEANKVLEETLLHQKVRLEIMDVDRYRRMVGVIWKDNRNINQEMVSGGWAWAYRQYLSRPYASAYLNSEELARRQRRGLWAQDNPLPPWEFRKQQKGRKSKSAQLAAPGAAPPASEASKRSQDIPRRELELAGRWLKAVSNSGGR